MACELLLSASALVRRAREKQESLGFDLKNDMAHNEGELARAAAYFAMPGPIAYGDGKFYPEYLLTTDFQDLPTINRSTIHFTRLSEFTNQADLVEYVALRIKDLAKAGALIQAEIQRLQTAAGVVDPVNMPDGLD